MEFKELLEKSGMKMTEFGVYFDIPYRTLQHWKAGTRECPAYVLQLMRYKLENENKINLNSPEPIN